MLQQMIEQYVLPAAISERTAACADVAAQRSVFGEDDVDNTHAVAIHTLIQNLHIQKATLKDFLTVSSTIEDEQLKAEHLATTVAPQMESLREVCDSIEMIVDDKRWRLPKYREMLFQN